VTNFYPPRRQLVVTTGINLLDIAIPIILLLYFLAGLRSGFFTTLGTFLGLGLGVCAAAWLVPLAVASVGSQWSLITAVGVLIICLTIGQWLGLVAGRTIRRVTDITPLKGVERFFGGVLNLAACALVMVVLTISMRTVPIPQLNTALSDSKTLSWMVASTPEVVKDRINTVRNDVLAFGTIPEVSQLIAPETSAPTETVESVALDRAAASVVEILGAAEQCGYTSTGSGFVADNGLVVTNAHVVAGVTSPVVQDSRGRTWPGTVVYMDTEQDIAFISVPKLPLEPLTIGTNATAGSLVTFMGYPKGGPFKALPATVQGIGNTQTIDADTGRANAMRQVYQLAADVQHGNSGGPVLDENGNVVGVIFGRATTGQTGYAITASTLKQALAEGGDNTAAVSTGTCRK